MAPFEKLRRIEARLQAHDAVEGGSRGRAGLSDALPALGRVDLGGGTGLGGAGQAHHIVIRLGGCVAWTQGRVAARERIEGRLLTAGLLPQDGAETPDHENGEYDKNKGRDVEGILHRRSVVSPPRPVAAGRCAEEAKVSSFAYGVLRS